MMQELLKEEYSTLYMQLVMVSMLWTAILIAVALDLYFGIKKSKSIGEHTTSEGFRRTIHKFVYYYSLMTFALLFDFIDVITPHLLPFPLSSLPLFSILFSAGLIFTEAKSVRENAEDKLRRKVDKSLKDVMVVLEKRQDIMNELIEIIKTKKNEQDITVSDSYVNDELHGSEKQN